MKKYITVILNAMNQKVNKKNNYRNVQKLGITVSISED